MSNNKPKVEITELNQSMKLKLLHDTPYIDKNKNGEYYLYGVKNEKGEELSFFAPADIHSVLQEHKLKTGDEFLLSRVSTGKNGSTKLQISIIGKEESETPKADSLKDIMIRSMKDAAEVVASVPALSLRAEDARAIGLSLFIART
jgi:hypothetical protein